MGTDIDGAFGHRVSFPPTEELARRMCVGIQPVSPIFENDWALDPDYASSRLVRIHTRGLSVWFGPGVAIASTGFGWDQVIEDPDLKGLITSAVCAVARFFHSPGVVYLPDDIHPWCNVDDWVAEGVSFDVFRLRLARIKGASTDFAAAIKQSPDSWEVDGYVIEELSYETV